MAQKKPAPKLRTPAKPKTGPLPGGASAPYHGLLSELSALLAHARAATARAVNGVMTATYYELGRRIVEFEQGGKERAGYGEEIITRLSADLTKQFGRGFSRSNLFQIRGFYLGWQIVQTPSGLFQIRATHDSTEEFGQLPAPAGALVTTETFPLPWSHYVRLMTVASAAARHFYEEAIKGEWSVRQLDRQISTQFYERLAGSKRKSELLARPHVPQAQDANDPSLLVGIGSAAAEQCGGHARERRSRCAGHCGSFTTKRMRSMGYTSRPETRSGLKSADSRGRVGASTRDRPMGRPKASPQ